MVTNKLVNKLYKLTKNLSSAEYFILMNIVANKLEFISNEELSDILTKFCGEVLDNFKKEVKNGKEN